LLGINILQLPSLTELEMQARPEQDFKLDGKKLPSLTRLHLRVGVNGQIDASVLPVLSRVSFSNGWDPMAALATVAKAPQRPVIDVTVYRSDQLAALAKSGLQLGSITVWGHDQRDQLLRLLRSRRVETLITNLHAVDVRDLAPLAKHIGALTLQGFSEDALSELEALLALHAAGVTVRVWPQRDHMIKV
jgi:hypothetical protein